MQIKIVAVSFSQGSVQSVINRTVLWLPYVAENLSNCIVTLCLGLPDTVPTKQVVARKPTSTAKPNMSDIYHCCNIWLALLGIKANMSGTIVDSHLCNIQPKGLINCALLQLV
jgi:hypothetical protein